MIKKLLFSLLILSVTIGAIAQNSRNSESSISDEQIDQVKAMKIGFMSEQMKLTSQQSIAFWPLYNEYWMDRYELFELKRKTQDKITSQKATNADINELIRVEQEQAELMRVYVPRFEKVISTDQVAKMFVAEENFKSVLLKTLKD